jgi:hypothetical protein
MKNYALLLEYTAQRLLSESLDGDHLIYEDDLLTQARDGSLFTKHHQISESQAKAIMRKIVQDDVICEALRNGIEKARLNPNGNMPVGDAHPVDPNVALVNERAILPVLGELPPSGVTFAFVGMAYDHVRGSTLQSWLAAERRFTVDMDDWRQKWIASRSTLDLSTPEKLGWRMGVFHMECLGTVSAAGLYLSSADAWNAVKTVVRSAHTEPPQILEKAISFAEAWLCLKS